MIHDLDRAIQLATEAHRGQTRHDGVTPYITHPMAVSAVFFGKGSYIRVAAVLHDVVEDTPLTLTDLMLENFDHRSIAIVALMTRWKSEKYFDYIQRIKSSGNRDAIAMKRADISHNSIDATPSMNQRYDKALKML